MKNSRKRSRGNSRPLMFAASSVWVALILVILVFRGGVTAPVEPHPVPSGRSPAQQADARAALGDYEGAWGLYNQALQAAPEDVSLWYALGVTLSHLNQRKETEEAFRYVVRRGRPDSEEARLARRWLVSAGVLAETPVSVSSPDTEPEARLPEQASSPAAPTGGGRVRGRTGARPGTHLIQLALEGDEDSNREIAFAKSVKTGEPYEFAHVPPGNYRLKGEDPDSETQLWDVPVTVTAGKETVLDLTGGDSPISAGSR